MEDLYSNLENYDDVNAVDELKNENRELKHKLEECSKAMNQLQKDFDKLNSEYKKLEINYSSLLKTARAEIERKTQLITNLNKEKDMIVIRAMQGGCRNVLKNVNKPVHNYKKKYTNVKDEDNKEMLNKNKPGLSGNSREGSRESPLLLMKDKMAPATNMSTSSEQNLRQLHDGHSKENMLKSAQYQTNDSNKPKTAKISARRKSMPVSSNWEEHISSEEDVMKDYNTNTRDFNKHQDYDNFRQNSQHLGSKGGQKNNRSEQFTNETKQTYNRGVDRYNPHFDRYTYNQQYGNYSPERGRPQQHRGSDNSHRSDYYRQRVLESPPKDNYNRSKSRERRHRERDHRRDFDYYNSRYEENYDARSNIREPDLKRRRMDSSSMDRERHDQAAERRTYRLSEYRPSAAIEDHTSCQSPDYDQIEYNFDHHSIKEIKNIATVQLEDPRINSKKYSLKESEQGIFITTVDKNICMLQVDKTLWGFENVEVPEALKTNIWEEPANEDIVNCIYMGIDDPANILSSKSSKNSTDCSKSESTGSPNGQGVYRKEYSTSDKIEQKFQKTNVEVSETIVSDYKIQKKSKVDVKSNTSIQDNVNINDCNHFNKKLSLNDNKQCSNYLKNEISNDNYQLKSQQLAPVEHNIEGDLELSDEASDITDELQITCKQSDRFTHVSDRDKSRDVGIDGKCKENDHKNDETQKKDKTVMEDNNDFTSKNIAKQAAHSIEKEGKIQVNVDSEKASKEASLKKIETCKKEKFTYVSDRDKSRDVGIDGKRNEKDHKNDETQKKDKTVMEDNYIISKNIAKQAAHSKEKDGKIQINVDSEMASKEASLKKIETCKNKKFTHVSDRDKSRHVGIDGKCKEKDHKNDETQKKDKTIMEDNNDITFKNIAKHTADSKEKEGKIQINVDSEKASKEEASLKKYETSKKKTSKKKCDGKSLENKDIKMIEKTNESFRIELKETNKRAKRKRLSSNETEKERKESKVSHINTGENLYENKCKDSKPYSKFTELFGESSSLITPEDLNIATKFDISIERNDNYESLFENTQDAIDLNVREIKEVAHTVNNNLEVLENVEVLSNKEDSPNTIDEKSLFEIKGDQANDNVYKNLKPAIIDDESNIVKTVVISSGTQPRIEENNTNQKKISEMDSNEAKETEKVVKHQPLEFLRAVATSTPNKMQHEDLPRTTTVVTPDGENLNTDSNVSYTASLTTATNVEANSDAPDVRIFIKRRRKIKKI